MSKDFRIIAIGASAGGNKSITKIVSKIPSSINAAILIVVHSAFDSNNFLDKVLQKETSLLVRNAENGMSLEAGEVYIAQPDYHLVANENCIKLLKGPKENLFRPAIDVLFRSVAVNYSSQVIGVLLSGRLNDGTSGLEAIKKCGGITIIENPESAEYGDMPRSANEKVKIDHVLNVEEIAEKLETLTNNPITVKSKIPNYLKIENSIVQRIGSQISTQKQIGSQVPIACPSCSGPLWQMGDTKIDRFRCHVGHSFTNEALLKSQSDAVEEALWISLRTLEEKKIVLERILMSHKKNNANTLSLSFKTKINEVSNNIEKLRSVLELQD